MMPISPIVSCMTVLPFDIGAYGAFGAYSTVEC